jgi:Stage II sporulation protein E (SpoIIE)
MRFYGATRSEAGKAMNDDAFACLGDWAILLDGAGNAQGAAKGCVDFLVAQLEASPDLSLSELTGIANQFLLGSNQESTLLALHVQGSALLTAASCGDSPLYLVREDRVEQMNEITKPRLGTLQPGIKYLALPLRTSDVIIGASDGLCIASYRILSAVQRTMLRPDSMPEAILQTQRDSFDDVTLVCAVI